MDRETLDELKKILPVLLPYGVRRISLFGSIVRGETTAGSNIDILVELRPIGECPPIGLKWFALEEELQNILGREVDPISRKALSPYILPYVEKEEIVIYEEG